MNKSRHRVVMAIPSQQYADQLAAALAHGGLLERYYCGTPPRAEIREQIGARFTHIPLHRALHFAARKLLPHGKMLDDLGYALLRSFDRRIARLVRASPADTVIGYENAALETFRAAKALGKLCILDAADVHYTMQQAMGDTSLAPDLQNRVNAHKCHELELADYILCCSEMAKQSYVAAGFPSDRIFPAGLGADLGRFTANPQPRTTSGPVRFLFAGRFTPKKGADILATALERMKADAVPFELEIASDTNGADPGLIARFRNLGRLLGKLPQEKLPALMGAADCLLVPSRFDSYGMVVAEALACGTPALVSDRVGAKDLIENGSNGFVVPAGEVDALYQVLSWCATHKPELVGMSAAAARAGAGADWSRYRNEVLENVQTILERHWG